MRGRDARNSNVKGIVMKKRSLKLLARAVCMSVVGAAGFAPAAIAADAAPSAPLSATGGIISDYVWRGISQSADDPAPWGEVDLDLSSVGLDGFSVGTWMSAINFGKDSAGNDLAPMEMDLYGGYSGNFGNSGIGYTLGLYSYLYPNSAHGANFNWFEYYAGLSYDFGSFSASGKVYYSSDFENLSMDETYITGGISIPVSDWLSVAANVGHTSVGHAIPGLIEDYTDFNVSASATYGNFTFGVGYSDTDLSGIYKYSSGLFQTTGQGWVSISYTVN